MVRMDRGRDQFPRALVRSMKTEHTKLCHRLSGVGCDKGPCHTLMAYTYFTHSDCRRTPRYGHATSLSPSSHAPQELRRCGRKHSVSGKQPEVNRALMEAWSGFLIRDPRQPAPWYSISRSGEGLLTRNARHERWEQLGLDRVKSDLVNNEGRRTHGVSSGSEELDWAWEWVRMKHPRSLSWLASETLIADSRLAELRALTSPQLDFRKLVRLCEELNISSREECRFATAMLTRGLLDHVPPILGLGHLAKLQITTAARRNRSRRPCSILKQPPANPYTEKRDAAGRAAG